jgi:hypothetical protein
MSVGMAPVWGLEFDGGSFRRDRSHGGVCTELVGLLEDALAGAEFAFTEGVNKMKPDKRMKTRRIERIREGLTCESFVIFNLL